MSGRFPSRKEAQAATRRVAETTGTRVRPSLVQNMLEAQKRERAAVLAGFVQVKGLMPLLMRHRNGGSWSRAERVELQQQLRALAYLSPYLFILLLPGSFALLPVYAWWLDRRRLRRGDKATDPPPRF